jgi:hypothetical protein
VPINRAVYFRRADGRGTQVWGTGYGNDMEAILARDICFKTPDATLVWATPAYDSNQTLGAVLTRDVVKP